MKKIVFGITGLTLGGAERVLVDIANELSKKYDITIFTLYGKGEFEKELSKNVKLVNMIDSSYNELTKMQKIYISLKLLLNKKSIYNKYIKNKFDTEIAFLEGPITRLFSVTNKNVKKIAWVHNDISQVFGKKISAKAKRKLDKRCYIKYNNVVFVSNDNKKQFEKIYDIEINKSVIQNYISVERILEKSEEIVEDVYKTNEINFLTVARLTEQKAIDRLVKVHSELLKDGYCHNIYCIGDGPEKNNIQNLINHYNVQNSFIMLGKKDNPYPYIKKCDVFALLSKYEGFGMTIIEAEILNKMIIITDTAAREAVQGYSKAYIVENSENGIYEGMKHIIEIVKKENKKEDNNKYNNKFIINQIEKLVE